MDAMDIGKVVCGFASVIAGFVSCVYWYRSSKAEVLWDNAHTDDIGFEVDGKTVAMVATSRKQSNLSAKGAFSAATAALFQLLPMSVETWLLFTN